MEHRVTIAPMGEEMDTLFPVLRTFPTEKIVLIASDDTLKDASKFKEKLEVFRIPVEIVNVEEFTIDEIFKIIKKVANSEKDKEVLINVASGDKVTSCFTLCAAYVYGMKAVAVMGENVVLLPIMKFSYEKTISDSKLKILRSLCRGKGTSSFGDLESEISMSPPLLSYHLNGTAQSDGLKQMGLVETQEAGKKVTLELTSLGRMLMSGYL